MKSWERRALNPNTPTTKDNETIKSRSSQHPKTGKEILYPMIRYLDGKLVKYKTEEEAKAESIRRNDFIEFDTPEEATKYSRNLSERIGIARRKAKK
tara:strand:- start:56 stop:346 length:291 start_codon:yes stop_codon:yes gene_type:complete